MKDEEYEEPIDLEYVEPISYRAFIQSINSSKF
jgi:hypothetical protein